MQTPQSATTPRRLTLVNRLTLYKTGVETPIDETFFFQMKQVKQAMVPQRESTTSQSYLDQCTLANFMMPKQMNCCMTDTYGRAQ